MDWQPIATAPFDRDLELAVIDHAGVHELLCPCRRRLRGWVKADTNTPVNIYPTHWREWGGFATNRERRTRSGADRTLVLKHLALAEHHVDQGKRHLARQEELIAKLDRDGLDTTQALKMLATLQETQALHEADVERFLRELGKSPPPMGPPSARCG
jgi:hypothetical protein